MNRLVVIVGSVLLIHIGALWALHTGLLRRLVETVVPVALLSVPVVATLLALVTSRITLLRMLRTLP